jgi:hypothetical protein
LTRPHSAPSAASPEILPGSFAHRSDSIILNDRALEEPSPPARQQGLSGLSVARRTLGLAAAALGAGGDVQQALPGLVLDLADAELLEVLLL